MRNNYEKRRKSNVDVSFLNKNNEDTKKSIKDYIFTDEYLEGLDKQKTLDDFNSAPSTKAKNINTNRKKKEMSITKKLLLTLLILTLVGMLGLFIFFRPYISIAVNSYNEGLDTTRIDVESVPHIYDRDGNLISIMYGYYNPKGSNIVPTYSSKYVNLNSMPKYVAGAFTSIEDESFYENPGISVNRFLYATFNYVIKGDSSFGGSTITQQLVKVSTGDDGHSASRKAREIGSALYLTDNWSKDKILASYINLVYYGSGAYGIYEASYTYFNTAPENLNIAQAAVLASLPNSPENLNPYYGEKSKEKLLNRQKIVLDKMLELGIISEEEYTEAKKFNIEFTNGSSSIPKNNPAIQQYMNVAMTEVIDIIKSHYNCDGKKALELLLSGKTIIKLNMRTDLQKKSYEIASTNYTDYGNLELGTVLTTKSGEVLSLVGSRTGSQVDHAYKMTRQTGSSIKPITVYGPAFDMGLTTPNSYISDSPTSVKTASGTWNVVNADRGYRGTITVERAIALSLNTTAVVTLQKVGLENSYNYAKSFGITSLTKDDLYYPALGLGGFTYGVSPYELTQAYNTFNNDGIFRSISTVQSIEIMGETITKDKNEHQVISKSANDMVKQSMYAVGQYGTGRTANLGYTKTYLKTGTTNDRKDLWTCGFTDDVTSCMWGGYDTPQEVNMYNMNKAWKEIINYYYGR